MYWTAIEVYVAIIIPSLPAIRSLLSHHYLRWFPNDSPLEPASEQGPYVRASGGKRSGSGSGGTGSTFVDTLRSGMGMGSRDGEGSKLGTVNETGEGETTQEWLELMNKSRGTVHTGVVAGTPDQDKNRDGDGGWFLNNEGRGILVRTSTETVVQAKGQIWLHDVEVGGSGDRESWNLFESCER